jgi:hypothetical protein
MHDHYMKNNKNSLINLIFKSFIYFIIFFQSVRKNTKKVIKQ